LDVANANIFVTGCNATNIEVQLVQTKAHGGMSSQLEKLEMSTEGGQKSARALNWLRLGLPKIKENFSVLQGGGGEVPPFLGQL